MITDLGYCTVATSEVLPAAPDHSTLLCVGTAELGNTIEAVRSWREENACDVAACNKAIPHLPCRIDVAVSLHAELLAGWVSDRKYKRSKPLAVSSQPIAGVDVAIASDRPVGTSAMLAVIFGRLAGYRRIVLAGVKLNGDRYALHRKMWKAARAKGLLDGVQALTCGWVSLLLAGRLK